MKKDLYEFPLDALLTSDEWNHVRELITGELESAALPGPIPEEHFPFIAFFEGKMKEKLLKAGFKKRNIENQRCFKTVLNGLAAQGRTICGAWNYPPFAYGYPDNVVKVEHNDGKSIYWINPDIEAALRALEGINILKKLLPDGFAVQVFLRTFELTINLSRAGLIPELAQAETKKRANSSYTRELKKKIIREAIDNVFQAFPNVPKTLGTVWSKFDFVNKGKCFKDRETKKEYRVETGTNKKGRSVVIITATGIKPIPYAKRSLQHFIDELK